MRVGCEILKRCHDKRAEAPLAGIGFGKDVFLKAMLEEILRQVLSRLGRMLASQETVNRLPVAPDQKVIQRLPLSALGPLERGQFAPKSRREESFLAVNLSSFVRLGLVCHTLDGVRAKLLPMNSA